MTDAGDLQDAFGNLVAALTKADLPGFYGLILPDAVIMDEDLPFRVDRAGFQAHIAFHGAGTWEGFSWNPNDVRFRTYGSAGSASGFAMFRGKPRNAGYRLRPMLFTQGWLKDDAGWRIASWQQSPIVGHVSRPSPG